MSTNLRLIEGEGGGGDDCEIVLVITPRESEVWRAIITGRPNNVIARELSMAIDTVKTHVHRLLKKTGCHGRTDLAVHGLRMGVGTMLPYRMTRKFSDREYGILQLVAKGYDNTSIGALLGISPLTVKSHLARIAEKMGTGNRTIMAVRLYRAGLVDDDYEFDAESWGEAVS